MLPVLQVLPLLRNNIKPIFIATVVIISLLWCYNKGLRDKQAEWDKANSEIAAQIAKNTTDNKILAATLKGGHYVALNNIDHQFELNNRLSSEYPSSIGEGLTSSGIINTTRSSGFPEQRARIAKEREAIMGEVIGIAKARNLLAKHAETNTLTEIELQQFYKDSK